MSHRRRFTPTTITDTVVLVEKFIPGGQALGTLPDGKKIFFWNALPGETVTSYELTQSKSHFAEATALTVADPSPHRIAPRDDCYLATSPWQILDYDYELRQKSALLFETFRQFDLDPSAWATSSENPPTPQVQTDGQDFFYRNKMEYSLYYNFDHARIELAMRRRGSHQKIPITQSSIERPELFATAQGIVDQLNATGDEARNYQSLLLRCNQSGQVSGGLLQNHQPHPAFEHLTDTILGHSYSYSPNGFFQINLPIYQLALHEIKQHINTVKVLDLYAGVGTIGLSVARDHDLTLVELNPAAYHELEQNCQSAGSNSSIKPVLASADTVLDLISSNQTVILDPPRAGCAPALLTKLLATLPPTIIYLSCNPATQARDLRTLTADGHYRITTVTPYNFFPRTPHLENLVILQKS